MQLKNLAVGSGHYSCSPWFFQSCLVHVSSAVFFPHDSRQLKQFWGLDPCINPYRKKENVSKPPTIKKNSPVCILMGQFRVCAHRQCHALIGTGNGIVIHAFSKGMIWPPTGKNHFVRMGGGAKKKILVFMYKAQVYIQYVNRSTVYLWR